MDVEETALLVCVCRRKQILKKRKRKRLWTHPFVAARYLSGVFKTLYDDLRKYPAKFFNYVRMWISSFDELMTLCGNNLKKQDTILRKSITPEEKLFVTLRYLASSCSFIEIHYYYRLGRSTISMIIKEVCGAICENIGSCLKLPANEEEWKEISLGFEITLYYNYKHYFSIVLLAICDANYNFIYVDVGAYGKSNYSAIFKDTLLYAKLVDGMLNLPEPSSPSESESTPFPYVFVGDEAFGLHVNIMRPYGGNNLTNKKKIFNYRLSRARRFIECSFGILSNKWRIFHRPLNVHVDLAIAIVKTCCVLHNFVRARDGYSYDDTLQVTGFEPELENDRDLSRGGRSALATREMFADYFVNKNLLPWQNRCIH